jgi:hypothetical protein
MSSNDQLTCWLRRDGGQTAEQAKRAANRRFSRKRAKGKLKGVKELKRLEGVPENVQLDVLTVRGSFARLTFHGTKRTHVELNGILCGREGECVVMRVSKSKSKTSFEECVKGGACEEKNKCDEDKNCGC